MRFGRGVKETVSYGALIDIGSGSVGIGIIESDHEKEHPRILYSNRVYMRVVHGKNLHDEIMRYMKEALFTASLMLSKEGLGALVAHEKNARIDRILVTCSSPWAHTISRAIEFTDEKPFKITAALLNDLIASAESEIESSINESSIISELGLEPVERATVGTRINEYRVDNPIGKTGISLTLSQVTGLVPHEILDAVHEVQEKILPETKLSVHTYMLVAYCVIRELFSDTSSYTIVDVTGETTEIGIVVRGDLVETVHVPFGSNTLLRSLCVAENGTTEHARSLVRAYAEGKLHDDVNPQITAAIEAYESIIRKAMTTIHEDRQIPKTMLVTALPDVQPFFKKTVPSIVQKIIETDPVLFEFDKDFLKTEGSGTPDIFISLVSRFFHKLHTCGDITSAP